MMTVTGQHIQLTLRKSVSTVVDKFTTSFPALRKHSPYFLYFLLEQNNTANKASTLFCI